MIRALLFLLLAAGLAAYTFWVYTRLELPVRSGRALAAVRAVALLVILALLFDPRLPWEGGPGSGQRWALLDASLSMAASSAAGPSAWEAAQERAAALEAEGWTVVAFGDGVEGTATDAPEGARSTLAPALERAVEAGAGEVRVLSDFRFHDPVEVRAVLAAGAAPVRFEAFGVGGVNAGLGAFEVADAPRRGEEVFTEGVGDSVVVEFREGDRLVATRSIAPPPAGLRRRVEVSLPAPESEGRVRYTARVTVPGDGFPDDDEAVSYATAGYDEGALVLVSLTPDWEPRYLLPVLEEVTGLPTAGYLRVGADRFLPMGRAVDRGGPVDSATVRQAAGDAALLVVHGLAADAGPWEAALPTRAARVVAWPSDAAAAERLGLAVSARRAGEWYAADDVPSSPMAADLAGAVFQGLPPLTDPLVPSGAAGAAGAVPLLLQLGGTGPGEPALLLTRPGGRKVAVPLARGFWRWAARDGTGRDAYRRLWSGVAGWLLTEDRSVAAPDLRPAVWVVERGADVRWLVPDSAAVRLEVQAGEDVVVDTTFTDGGEAGTGPLPPGRYAYRAVGPSGDVVGEGTFDVARRTLEMAPVPAQPEAPEAVVRGGAFGGDGGGLPLRTSPWPYLLVLLLLSAEWIGRRRAGLR